MNHGRGRRRLRTRYSTEFQLASTSDIAFLLLIFFISTAIFVSPYGLPIVLPPAGAQPVAVEAEDLVTVELDQAGHVRAEGVPYAASELAAWARAVQGARATVVFRLAIHPDCPYESVVAVVDGLREAEAQRIHFGMGGGS